MYQFLWRRILSYLAILSHESGDMYISIQPWPRNAAMPTSISCISPGLQPVKCLCSGAAALLQNSYSPQWSLYWHSSSSWTLLPISSDDIGASVLTALEVQVQNLYNSYYKYYQRYINRVQKVFRVDHVPFIDTATLSQIINGSWVETRLGQSTYPSQMGYFFSRLSESLDQMKGNRIIQFISFKIATIHSECLSR